MTLLSQLSYYFQMLYQSIFQTFLNQLSNYFQTLYLLL